MAATDHHFALGLGQFLCLDPPIYSLDAKSVSGQMEVGTCKSFDSKCVEWWNVGRDVMKYISADPVLLSSALCIMEVFAYIHKNLMGTVMTFPQILPLKRLPENRNM